MGPAGAPSGNFPRAYDLVGLWPFLALDNVEFDFVTLLQALITIKLNRAVMNEYIRPIIAADKSIALCVVEPLHFAFVSCHEP